MIAIGMLEEIKDRNRKALENRLTEKGGYIIDEEGIKLDGDYFKRQVRIALKNCDVIDPTSIEEYIAMDGYFSLENILKNMSQQEVIDVMKESGLRGRGGAGFPAGRKWFRMVAWDRKSVV